MFMPSLSVRPSFRRLLPLLLLAAGGLLAQPAVATEQAGTLSVQRHGNHGSAVILIPGLQGGPWVWQQTIDRLQKDHVVYAVTLAGFDGKPAPADGGNLFDRADESLLQLIKQDKIDKPVLVGHSLGGTLALRFAGEHPELISGVVAVDGLPIFPGMERASAEQRQAMAAQMQQQMGAATQPQFQAQSLAYMQKIGVIDPKLAAQYAPMNARSDIKASARYMAEDLVFDGRTGLKNANVPILEISPYNAPDFSTPPMVMSEVQKTAYYQSLLADAPNAKVVSVSPSRHFVMLDQPVKFQQALDSFLKSL
ncbi:alpha/beta hydrolase [Rhodanobacter sp. AS-Z3]|uniref:alpha/beta fold hydrolase n=1 Tax=Rhodanobacter sp. AS-Z3 TaxID=3031330 RepID=UPI00247A71AC|nr:alpha/beta hydrolase [Rhodanobacter sp. AS-Z3]WEN15214.1 alpha/beta hydrolase [Rhodanobacter sp. AS-Z3]